MYIEAREVLHLYKNISRAKLNLEKTTLVAMDDQPPLLGLPHPVARLRSLGKSFGIWEVLLVCRCRPPLSWSSCLERSEKGLGTSLTDSYLCKAALCSCDMSFERY